MIRLKCPPSSLPYLPRRSLDRPKRYSGTKGKTWPICRTCPPRRPPPPSASRRPGSGRWASRRRRACRPPARRRPPAGAPPWGDKYRPCPRRRPASSSSRSAYWATPERSSLRRGAEVSLDGPPIAAAALRSVCRRPSLARADFSVGQVMGHSHEPMPTRPTPNHFANLLGGWPDKAGGV